MLAIQRRAAAALPRLAGAPAGGRAMSGDAKVWWESGVKFACTACGRCCRKRDKVFVNESEIEALGAAKKMSVDEFKEKHVVLDEAEGRWFLKKGGLGCTLLQGRRCSVFDARPTQCRTYPFWPSIMHDKNEFEREKHMCEGLMPQGHRHFPTVSRRDITMELIVHSIHDAEEMDNLTYNQSIDLLREVAKVSPQQFTDYEQEFIESEVPAKL